MMGSMSSGRRPPEPVDVRAALTPAAQDLTVALDGSPVAALDDWDWIGLGPVTPVMRTWFGDVVLLGHDGIWLLDVIEGTLERCWSDVLDLAVALADDDGQDRHLLGGLVIGAHRRGLVPSPTEAYAFSPPPVLGGAIDLDHLVVEDWQVHLARTGRIFAEVRKLPPGTSVIGVDLT